MELQSINLHYKGLKMKIKISLVTSALALGLALSMLGCSSSGGGDGGGGGGSAVTTSYTSVSGTTGASSGALTPGSLFSTSVADTDVIDGSATLIVDSNSNGTFDTDDIKYSAPIVNGSFSFSEVAVSATVQTKAQLSVAKDGFAPYVKTLMLTKDNALTVLAEIGKKPVYTEVIDLSALSSTDRASSFVKFGIASTDSGISSFSKLMSLSEFKAEVDLNTSDNGILSSSVIPAGAFPTDVTTVTASMQAFDSTDAEDFNYFPGSLSGHGKPAIGASATTDTTEKSLESAGFDMIKLTDQNGEQIDLAPVSASKLSALGIFDACTGMKWTRYITNDQVNVIKAWGDDDNNSANGFQVPIWSNDNSTGSWEYIGLADFYETEKKFEMCVDTRWQGYLNCDSEISIETPKQVCISAVDQSGDPFGNVNINARLGNGGSYASAYLGSYGDNIGKGTLGLTSGVPDDWTFTYSGAITGWSSVAITQSATVSTTVGCDYDLNIIIDNPFSAEVRVKAYAIGDTAKANPLVSARVSLISNDYSNYYSQTAYTDANGEAVFAVKPNVAYVASYKAGSSDVNVNGAIVSPETADSGVYASVAVIDANMAPNVYVYTNKSQVTTKAETLGFTISASDKNYDLLTLSSLKLNDKVLVEGTDYSVSSKSSYNGSLYIKGILDINNSATATYTLTAEVTDSKVPTVQSTTFVIAANHAPTISSLYLVDATTGRYYYENSAIPVGDYSVSAYVYDIDGDVITKTITIDGIEVTGTTSLAMGDHNVSVTASDDSAATATRTIKVFVGNHPPVINSSGATRYIVDINANETFKLYAYVTDAEKNPVTVKATDVNQTEYTLTRLNSYDTKYSSQPITLTTAKDANTFTIVANDGSDNSIASTVTVKSIASNQAPIFDVALSNITVNVNTSHEFVCQAHDPENTAISYEWKLNGSVQSATGTTFTYTFTSTGSNNLTCTATDGDAKVSTSSAIVTVTDPAVSGTLTVHTGYQGVIVSRHDLSTYALLDEKVTNSSGDASFAVTGDRTTFAVSAWSGMEVDATFVMEMLKPEFEYQAKNACYGDTNVSECTTADWCAMSQTTTIANWVWDIRRIYDETPPPLASVVDTNNDGYISATELYSAAVLLQDANSDGKLTWSEINGEDKDVHMEVFANVPVREYYIEFSPFGMNMEQARSTQTEMCSNNFDFNVTITDLAPNTYYDVRASGGNGYGYNYATSDENGTIVLPVYPYSPGTDGKYSFLFQGKELAKAWNYYALKSKTQTELEGGITLSANAFNPADTNVTIINNATNRIDSIDAKTNGLSVTAVEHSYLDYNETGIFSIFTDSSFSYGINGYENYYTDNMDVFKHSENYYTTNTLASSYSAVDYPQLSVNVTFDKNGNWQLSGDDMSAINNVSFEYNKGIYDYNTSTSMNLSISMNWTVAPSSMPDINITAVAPSALVNDITTIENATGNYSSYLFATDIKGITDETSFINTVAGANSQNIDDIGYRNVGFYQNYYNYNTVNYSAESKTKMPPRTPFFSIGYDTKKLFAK